MTSFHYVIRQVAHNDLEEIWRYTYNKWGIDQADAYIGLLLQRFEWIAKNPNLGIRRDDIKTGYYCCLEGRHLIFYTLNHRMVDIIGIPHQSMDVVGHLDI
jgi:toxin ParE1/3/4